MKRTYLAIALAFLTGVITLTLDVNRPGHVLASRATPVYAGPLMTGGTDALLLSCMDYRLTDEIADYMQNQIHMKRKYDYVILAGASLGVNNTKYPNWGKTFWEHLNTAIALHGIHEVIIMDHRNCGAYKLLLGKDFPADASPAQLKEETEVHKHQLDTLAKTIHDKYPNLEVETLLMSLNGDVEEIGHLKVETKSGVKH
jgi:carbonic anhydrase